MASAYSFSFPRLGGGEDIRLSDYKGRALLVVNVASACGFTPQYRELQQLWDAKAAKGLVVLGIPSNDFGRQESGAESEIAEFCADKYGVTFPMTGKVEIGGPERHPFFSWISMEQGESAMPRWNFHKFLFDREGQFVAGFPSSASPLGPEVLKVIGQTLDAKAA